MKKIKLFFAAFIAASAFCLFACSNASGGGGSSNSDFREPLFPSSEATEIFNGFLHTWSDGDWRYQEIQTGSNWKTVNYYELTISNNGQSLSLTKGEIYRKNGAEEDTQSVPSDMLSQMNSTFQYGMRFWYKKANPEKTKFFGHEDEKQDSRKGPHTVDTYLMKK